MKADRLLSALLLLQSRGRVTGREMAERLEVSGRTVHRDMEALGAAGVPVYALRGSRGGWQLDEDWRTQVPGLDEAELRALLMAQPRLLGDARLAAAAERALGKLMASLPVSMRAQANSIRQRLHIDTTGWRGLTETVDALPVVQEAVARDRKLTFHYRKPDGERSERTVDPLGLVAKGAPGISSPTRAMVSAPSGSRASIRPCSSRRQASVPPASTLPRTGKHRRSSFERRAGATWPPSVSRRARPSVSPCGDAPRRRLTSPGPPSRAGSPARWSSTTRIRRASWHWGSGRAPKCWARRACVNGSTRISARPSRRSRFRARRIGLQVRP